MKNNIYFEIYFVVRYQFIYFNETNIVKQINASIKH